MSSAKKTLVILGFASCGYFQRATAKAREVAQQHSKLYGDPVVRTFATRQEYQDWVQKGKQDLPAEVLKSERAKNHKSSPFVYEKETNRFVGGCDDTLAELKQASI